MDVFYNPWSDGNESYWYRPDTEVTFSSRSSQDLDRVTSTHSTAGPWETVAAQNPQGFVPEYDDDFSVHELIAGVEGLAREGEWAFLATLEVWEVLWGSVSQVSTTHFVYL